MNSVEKENIEIIKLLLNRNYINIDENNFIAQRTSIFPYGIDKKLKNKELISLERTVLHHAVEIGNLEIIKLLLEKKGTNFDFNKIIESSDIQLRRAIHLRNKGKYLESLKEFENVLKNKKNPLKLTDDDIIFQIAFTYQKMDENEKAKKLYDELYQRHPNTPEIIYQYCLFLMLKNDNESFNIVKEIISKAEDDDSFICFIKALIAQKENQNQQEYQFYSNCTTKFHNDPFLWFSIGNLYAKNYQANDAIAAYQRLIYLKKDFPEAWLNMALLYQMNQSDNSALKIYLCAENICPSNLLIIERKKNYLNGNDPSLKMLIEYPDSNNLIHIAEKIANKYIIDTPDVLHEIIGSDFNSNNHISLF